jgi:hypothetical protein
MSNQLVEYLKGKRPLTEYNFLSPGVASGPGGGMVTGRMERLKQAWGDLTIKLEALWLDILDIDEQVYEEAEQTLKDIRSTGPEGCKAALPYFKNLTSLLRKSVYVDKYAADKNMRLFHSRMAQLLEELIYLCDEYDPDAPKVPGAPVKSKEQWDLAQKADSADVTFKDPAAPEEEEPQAEPGQEPEEQPVPGEEPEEEPVPGEEPVEPEEEPEEPDASQQQAQMGDVPAEEPGMEPEEPEEPEPEDPALAQEPQEPAPEQPDEEPVDPDAQVAPEPEEPEEPEEEPQDDGKPDFLKKKAKKESAEHRLPPKTSSLVLASFAKAADSISENLRDSETEFLEAGATLQAALEEYTDVAAVYTEVGAAVPGSVPRIDVYTEWESSATCYGYGRLAHTAEGLGVFDARDRVRDVIEVTEDITDEEVANRVYLALETVHDVDARRVFSESRTIPALYKLIEQARRGIDLPETSFASILQGLRPRLGLQGEVCMVSQEISLQLDEDFSDLYNYHFAWAVRTPLTHVPLPDELSPENMEDPVPSDEDQDAELAGMEPYVAGAPVRDADDEDLRATFAAHGIGERKQGEAVAYWRTPGIAVSIRDQAIYFVHEGKKEKIDPDTKDEDISARLASMAYQKEDISSGRIIEGVQVNRRDVYEAHRTALGSVLENKPSSLSKLSMEELHTMAIERGLKVPGDGVTWSRDKLVDYLSGDGSEWEQTGANGV